MNIALLSRFSYTQSIDDVDASIRYAENGFRLLPDDHSDFVIYASALATALFNRFWAQKHFQTKDINLEDVDRAIDLAKAALARIQPDHSGSANLLYLIGNILASRADYTSAADLNDGINFARKGFHKTRRNHPLWIRWAHSFYQMLRRRIDDCEQISDIEEAIEVNKSIVAIAQESEDANLNQYAHELGEALMKKYKQTHELDLLQEVIGSFKMAIVHTSDIEMRAFMSLNVGSVLHTRYMVTHDVNDLNESINVVKGSKSHHQEREYQLECAESLAKYFMSRYYRTSQITDVDEAIREFTNAIELCDEGNQKIAGLTEELGSAYRNRYEKSESISDLNHALEYGRMAIEMAAPADASFATFGVALLRRFEHFGRIEDINKSIEYTRTGIAICEEKGVKPDTAYHNLSIGLKARSDATGSMTDLKESIEYAEKAVAAVDLRDIDLPLYANNLSRSLQTRFRILGQIEDLERAITAAETSVQLTPEDHPARAARQRTLLTAVEAVIENNITVEES